MFFNPWLEKGKREKSLDFGDERECSHSSHFLPPK